MVCQECGTKNPEDARFCFNCATPLSPVPQPAVALHTQPYAPQPAAAAQTQPYGPQQAQPKKRRVMKTCLMVSGALFVLVVFCGALAAITSDGDQHTASVEKHSAAAAVEDEPADEEAPPRPEQQVDFIETVESFYEPYQEAENELQASGQHPMRRQALAALLPDRAVQDWTGTLESLDTNSDGDAYITIRPDGAESITIATWHNSLVDAGTDSLIPPGSELYTELAEMSAGDQVVFSGTFAAGDQDHIAEAGVTEAASMTEPRFVMVFSDVTQQE
ncbi:MAG TPA: zinc ribbon domain-containing protein [Herpetosiphonaceae bacterium]|nr:zinc ribbon domain-containing protein [Herpetosiphonaceae bacterium]